MRITIRVVFFLALFSRIPGFADGYRVMKWLSREEMVRSARYLFTATIVRSDHRYAYREAYGERRRYLVASRFLVRFGKVLKGDGALWRAMGKETGPVWISRRGYGIPGRWVLIDRKYRDSVRSPELRPGMQMIVYGTSISDLVVQYEGLDAIRYLKNVREILGKIRHPR